MKTYLHCTALAVILTSIGISTRAATPSDAVARIDHLILEQLAAHQITPNPVASDGVFVRRLYLDLIGRIPTKRETLAYLEPKDFGKRADLIDSLIGSDGYVSHHFNYFADLLRAKTTLSGAGQSVPAGLAYEQWIKKAIRENKPYDKMVYELVTASGSTWDNAAVGYTIRDYGMPLDNLAITSQVFLGTQIVCAQCHNHPFDAMTQMDYYHLAAFTFGQSATNGHPVQARALSLLKRRGKGAGNRPINREQGKALRKAGSEILQPLRFNNVIHTDRKLRLPRDYQYEDAKPRSAVQAATFMGNEAVASEGTAPVYAFGEWLTSPENPRFTKVIANRLWKRAFGIGLIEPIDDLKDSTVASDPALMTYLEELMISLDYDLQAFQRILYRTDAYRRESSVGEVVPGTPYYFSGPILRRMSAEQIWDSLVTMTVPDVDAPDSARELRAAERLAGVQLIAESVYHQTAPQFLKNMRAVVKIQGELSLEIEAAQAKVADAREAEDPALIREANAEVRQIRRQLLDQIESIVYRDGLASKLALLEGKSGVKTISAGTAEVGSTAADDALIDALATVILSENRTFDEGMAEIVGTEGGAFIKPLVDAMFDEKENERLNLRLAQTKREMADWKVKSKEQRKAYRFFNKTIRPRMKRASELNSPAPLGHFLREFGQSDRELVENSNDQAAITQALAMLNGRALGAIGGRFSVLNRDMRGEKFEDRLDTIYLTMLSRLPTPEERVIFKEAWDAEPESGSVTGIVWTILNTRQFLFIQ